VRDDDDIITVLTVVLTCVKLLSSIDHAMIIAYNAFQQTVKRERKVKKEGEYRRHVTLRQATIFMLFLTLLPLNTK